MKITFRELRQIVREQLSEESFTREKIFEDISLVETESLMPSDLKSIVEGFELVNEQTVLKEAEQKIEELKTISEEIRRMKQLVDFRSPLLGKENS